MRAARWKERKRLCMCDIEHSVNVTTCDLHCEIVRNGFSCRRCCPCLAASLCSLNCFLASLRNQFIYSNASSPELPFVTQPQSPRSSSIDLLCQSQLPYVSIAQNCSFGKRYSTILASHFIPASPISPSSEQRHRLSVHASLNSTSTPSRLHPGLATTGGSQARADVPRTSFVSNDSRHMSLSRSPSPQRDGGWSTPGLTSSPEGDYVRKSYAQSGGNRMSWASAKERSAKVNGYSAFTSQNQSFLGRHFRTISATLPRFNGSPGDDLNEKRNVGRERWTVLHGRKLRNIVTVVARQVWRSRLILTIILAIVIATVLFYITPLHKIYRRASFLGGGNKFLIILAANQGGGVMEWKGPREWAIERDSVRNKRKYASKWGYNLEIVDMATKKRYAHEWRESWEKVDTMRRCMHDYPDVEWFWWLDLNTFIMEPTYSLQSHIFDDLIRNTYRDINHYNPLNIQHPLNAPYLDPITRSVNGDGKAGSINMVIPQDCGGFNMGSFFMRRSAWTDRLLDIWWDPVQYEQRHMQWEHKEQDAFEYLYTNQPWIRPHTAFIEQRKVSSFPPGACGENNETIHYREEDRDFLVNMAGCEWGRDCWGEMYQYRELSERLNRPLWRKIQDGLASGWTRISLQNEEKKG